MSDLEQVTISTTDVAPSDLAAGPGNLGTTPAPVDAEVPARASADALYPSTGPMPSGTSPETAERHQEGESNPTAGTGVDGEIVVWEGLYSMRNFIGRILFRSILTVGWVALAIATWGYEYSNLNVVAIISGIALGLLWLTLGYRIIMAKAGHFYRLTNRRLFVSTGVFGRRRDQMELVRIDDIFTRQQSLMDRWLGLGTVVVVSKEASLPTFYLVGVDDPKRVMDLIWHQARSEHDHRNVRVEHV